jgi:hypothetical protein
LNNNTLKPVSRTGFFFETNYQTNITKFKPMQMMKKLLFVFSLMLAYSGLQAQVLLEQDFSSGQMPPTGFPNRPTPEVFYRKAG